MLFIDLIDIPNSRIEGLLGQLAGLGPVTSDLIEEHRVVECQPQSHRMGGTELLLCDVAGLLVGGLRVVSCFLVVVAFGEF